MKIIFEEQEYDVIYVIKTKEDFDTFDNIYNCDKNTISTDKKNMSSIDFGWKMRSTFLVLEDYQFIYCHGNVWYYNTNNPLQNRMVNTIESLKECKVIE